MYKFCLLFLMILPYPLAAYSQTVTLSGYKNKKLSPLNLEAKFKGSWNKNKVGQLEYYPLVAFDLGKDLKVESLKGKQSEVKFKGSKVMMKMSSYRDLLKIKPSYKSYKKLAVLAKFPDPVLDDTCEPLNIQMRPKSPSKPPFFVAVFCDQKGNDLTYTVSVPVDVAQPRSTTDYFSFESLKTIKLEKGEIPKPFHVIKSYSFKYKGSTYDYDFVFEDKNVTEALAKQKEEKEKEKAQLAAEEAEEALTTVLVGFGNLSLVVEGQSPRISDEPLNFFIYYTQRKAFWGLTWGFQYWNGLKSAGGLYDVSYKDAKLFLGIPLASGTFYGDLRLYFTNAGIGEDNLSESLEYSSPGGSLFLGFKSGHHFYEGEYIFSEGHYNTIFSYTYHFDNAGFDLGALWSLQNYKKDTSTGVPLSYTQNFLNIFMRF